MRYLPSAIVLTVGLLLSGTPASAQSSNDALARSFFESGRAYFDRAEYDDAARSFAEAYRLSHRPALLLNQARALDEANRTREAVAVLEQADREIPASEVALHDEVTERLMRLRLEVARMDREAAAHPTAAGSSEPSTASTPEPAHESNTALVVSLVSGGAGVAMLAAALGTGVAASHVQDRLDANCPDNVCPIGYADDVSHGQRLARTSTAMAFIGVGALGAAVPLLLLGLRHGHEQDPRVSVVAGPGQIGSGLRLRF